MTTAANETCKNGGIAGGDYHPVCTCGSGFKGYDCSQRGKRSNDSVKPWSNEGES